MRKHALRSCLTREYEDFVVADFSTRWPDRNTKLSKYRICWKSTTKGNQLHVIHGAELVPKELGALIKLEFQTLYSNQLASQSLCF